MDEWNLISISIQLCVSPINLAISQMVENNMKKKKIYKCTKINKRLKIN